MRTERCRSIEHRWRSPQHWNPPEPRGFVDVLDALLVEKHVTALPRMFKQALAGFYIYRAPFGLIARKAGVRPSEIGTHLRNARFALANALRLTSESQLSRLDQAIKRD